MVLRLVLQRDGVSGDCCIAALATYLGLTYEDVLAVAARKQGKKVHHKGMHTTEIRRTAKALGHDLKKRRKWDDSTASGILILAGIEEDHAAVLAEGLVFDLRHATVWIPEIYYEATKQQPCALLTRREHE